MSGPDGQPRVAVFRPDDDRLAEATALLAELGVEPVADPMLAVEPTGDVPPEADVVVLTSKTGAELLAGADWEPGDAVVAAIGEHTAHALRATGYRVDRVPEEFSSAGLVSLLAGEVAGERVAVARSDHGSPVLLEGLREAGADVTETVLYRLVRPPGAGQSADLAAAGELSAALFTSSLTVEHFLAAAAERGCREDAIDGLDGAVVGTIGEPTRETAEREGIAADVVPERADFTALARATVDEIAGSRSHAR